MCDQLHTSTVLTLENSSLHTRPGQQHKILSHILLTRLTPHAEEVIGDHQCGYRRNRTTADHKLCIRQIIEKKWEYNEAVHQLFIDFKNAYVSVRREVLYNVLIEFGVPMKW